MPPAYRVQDRFDFGFAKRSELGVTGKARGEIPHPGDGRGIGCVWILAAGQEQSEVPVDCSGEVAASKPKPPLTARRPVRELHNGELRMPTPLCLIEIDLVNELIENP